MLHKHEELAHWLSETQTIDLLVGITVMRTLLCHETDLLSIQQHEVNEFTLSSMQNKTKQYMREEYDS